ncbi:transporter substrate-binding domain-containing protein [Aurantimonas sp. VKM B-3413]|uniref:transporter substrate-binding domain-containing protein n=1 Tax=Aurantimonas sp. VKM B-3413 TaxID=2779401 RepID=UPI001E600C4D|nr:transporter substrate-binding domain-containing protein [Aurantimonas sp. VKM B-3413]MCB8836232.1 transporter substrate-binding domain-containing protein [Aurantimonas sp. VKM B-3413]
MKLIRKVAALAAAAAMVAGLGTAAVKAQTLDAVKQRGTINVGMLVDFPPFGILNTEGKPDGYDADVARLLAKDLGVKLNLVPVTGPNRIPYLLSGQVDVLVASLGITPERAKQVDFSQPYAGIEIFVFGDKDVSVKGPEDLAGKNVGVARASTQDTAITKVAPDSANIQRFDDDASAVQALISGQVPLIGCSNTVVAQVEKVRPDTYDTKFSLSQQKQGIATRPGADKLMAAINDFLVKVKKDGELNKLHEKWLNAPLPDFIAKTKS